MDHLSFRVCLFPPYTTCTSNPSLNVNIFNHYTLFLSHFLDFIASFAPFFPFRCSGAWIGIWINSSGLFSETYSVWGLWAMVGVGGDSEGMEAPLALTLPGRIEGGGCGREHCFTHIKCLCALSPVENQPSTSAWNKGAQTAAGGGLRKAVYLGGLAPGVALSLWLWGDHLEAAKCYPALFRTGSMLASWKSCRRKAAEKKKVQGERHDGAGQARGRARGDRPLLLGSVTTSGACRPLARICWASALKSQALPKKSVEHRMQPTRRKLPNLKCGLAHLSWINSRGVFKEGLDLHLLKKTRRLPILIVGQWLGHKAFCCCCTSCCLLFSPP